MNILKSGIRLSIMTAAVAVLLISTAFASQTIAYPSAEKPQFTVTAPDNWKLLPAEEEGGFMGVEGPTGAVVNFRVLPGTEKDLNAAIEDTSKYVEENFDNVKTSEPEKSTMGGQPAVVVTGTGDTKEDKTPSRFVMAWAKMKNGHIAELWFATKADDKEGSKQAKEVVDSFLSE